MECVQHLPNLAKVVSSVAGSPELVCPTPPMYTLATAVLVCSEACGADKVYVNAVECVLDICCYYRDGF